MGFQREKYVKIIEKMYSNLNLDSDGSILIDSLSLV